ncbi:hypothetical protein B9Z19DRAFT_1008098 [Tuber borchii]|uniref:Beta/gamma crystallin 'Greek key' domain-containing protein n=1 Tax=Tuber borchii TaxID=42251 RepID=A0A2T6ZBC3_TUBBO|nr:hypothetical protein B9Z19DRAFT_1008098 [Tuber borchii]
MQAKVFLLSILSIILAVGVIATPVDVIPTLVDGERTPPPTDVNTLLDNGRGREAFFVGPPDPRPTGPIITPKEGDIPTPSRVVARDLENLEKRTPGCISATTNPNFTGASGRSCNIPNGHCANLTPFWRSNISSFRPDPYTYCEIFTGPNCSGLFFGVFTYPGFGLLGVFDNNMGSIKCWY